MISGNKNQLSIFNNFVIDANLPKFKREVINDVTVSGINPSGSFSTDLSNVIANASFDEQSSYMEYLSIGFREQGFYLRSKMVLFKKWIYDRFFSYHKRIQSPASVTLDALKIFFDDVKTSVNNLSTSDISEVLLKYETLLKDADDNHQVALVEKLQDYSNVIRQEYILSESKFNKYVTEEDVVKFHNKASLHGKFKTSLCMTYIKNFTRIIPVDVSKLKKEADELKVFDNYVILHYDYNGTGSADTKAEKIEKEKKKDPILFGVIRNSRRLYFIGDWVDEYCDLTLDVLIKKIGKKKADVIDKDAIISGIVDSAK